MRVTARPIVLTDDDSVTVILDISTSDRTDRVADSTGATGTFAPVTAKVLGREYSFAPVLFGLN